MGEAGLVKTSVVGRGNDPMFMWQRAGFINLSVAEDRTGQSFSGREVNGQTFYGNRSQTRLYSKL